MTREYIQRLAAKLLAKYRVDTSEFDRPWHLKGLLNAAGALDGLVNRGDVERQQAVLALEMAKNLGTAGYEMWFAGGVWLERYADT